MFNQLQRRRWLKQSLIGCVALGLYIINTLVWFIPMLGVAVLQLIPIRQWRQYCQWWLESIPAAWIQGNTFIQNLTIPRTRWIAKCHSKLPSPVFNVKAWYLLVSNHLSWVDTLVLQRIFNRRVPLIKFFLKYELLWSLPILSWMCGLLGFPFIKRYKAQQLIENPGLRMRNLETAQQACEQYKGLPTTVANFVEGTRFTPLLHEQQASPYQYLLRPQGGGIALTLATLYPYCDKILNVTLAYADQSISFWDFLCGRMSEITVYIEVLPVTPDLIGDYIHDKSFRTYIHQWLNQLWKKKDALLRGACNTDTWSSQLL